jgi:hypothetical protein
MVLETLTYQVVSRAGMSFQLRLHGVELYRWQPLETLEMLMIVC